MKGRMRRISVPRRVVEEAPREPPGSNLEIGAEREEIICRRRPPCLDGVKAAGVQVTADDLDGFRPRTAVGLLG